MAFAVVLYGGDDESTGGAGTPRKILAANEDPAAFALRMATLLETARTEKDCKEIYEINGRSVAPLPCPAPADFRKSMARFEVVGADIYGTGGVVDYKSGRAPDGAALVLYVARNRRWGVGHLGLSTEPSVGTGAGPSRAAYRATVDRYLEAVRKRDCDEFLEVAATATNDEEQNCREPFEATKPLADRLRRNPSAKLKYEGGNRAYGFFSLETPKPQPENSTISVIGLSDAGRTTYAVLDIVAAPTADDMHQLREDIALQRRLRKLESTTSGAEPLEP